jgi:DNA-binding GntR family transcriptional regulator
MGNAIRMAVSRCADAELGMLLAGIDEMIGASQADDHVQILKASAQFFMNVTQVAGNRAMQEILAECEYTLRRNLHGWSPHIADAAERTDVYRVFRDAVGSRDGDGAERVLRRQHGLG